MKRSMTNWKTSQKFLPQQHVVEQRPDNISDQCYEPGGKIARTAACFSIVTDRVEIHADCPSRRIEGTLSGNPQEYAF